jgi:hypothetical protein
VGWSYRKSVNFGPFRVNLSKEGLGYSVGGAGFRTGVSATGRHYRSVSVKGTGLRYYSSSKSKGGSGGCMVFLMLLAGGAVGLAIAYWQMIAHK